MKSTIAARLLGIRGNRALQYDPLHELEDAPLSPDGYHKFVFQWDEAFFRERVEMVGFVGADRVLDLGCGLGNWAIALSYYNRQVFAVDALGNMVRTTKILSEKLKRENVHVMQASLPHLGFKEEAFDSVWCGLVLEYIHRESAMRSINRLLRLGGHLYVSTNARGRWFVKAMAGVFERNLSLISTSLHTALRGNQPGRIPNFLRSADVADQCARFGFEVLAVGAEGCVDLSARAVPRERPMFPKLFLGLIEQNIEFVARKIGPPADMSGEDWM